MSDSKRLACLKALTAHLKGEISVANGYKHDLADETIDGQAVARVVRGRDRFDDDDLLPQISILESPNPDRFPNLVGDQDGIYQDQKDNWTIYLQGWVDDDEENPTDPAYELMADVKKALSWLVRENPYKEGGMHANFYLGGLITGLKFESGTVRPPGPEVQSSKAFFWMRVILEFVEDSHDPYKLD